MVVRMGTSPRRRRPSPITALVGTGAVLTTLCLGTAAAAVAQPKDAGEAVLVIGGEAGAHAEVGSATPFSLRLPKGAACPGDSANDGYRVQSFVVPASAEPGGLRYKSTGPQGDGRYSLYEVSTRGYVQVQTANADVPGGPGLILNVPSFSFGVLSPGMLADGTYHVGIACTLLNETVTSWHTDIVLTANASDRPAGFRWRSAAATPAARGRSPLATIGLLGLAVIAVALTLVVLRRPRRSSVSHGASEAS